LKPFEPLKKPSSAGKSTTLTSNRQGYGIALLHCGLQTLGHPAWLKCVAENQTAPYFQQINGWLQESPGDDQGSEFYRMAYAVP
jgi:hypothetical protein